MTKRFTPQQNANMNFGTAVNNILKAGYPIKEAVLVDAVHQETVYSAKTWDDLTPRKWQADPIIRCDYLEDIQKLVVWTL